MTPSSIIPLKRSGEWIWVFGIGYDDDIKKARGLIESIMAADERILKDPAASVTVGELADNSVNFNVRPWVKGADYWGVRADLLENVKLAFDANGHFHSFPAAGCTPASGRLKSGLSRIPQ